MTQVPFDPGPCEFVGSDVFRLRHAIELLVTNCERLMPQLEEEILTRVYRPRLGFQMEKAVT